MANKDYDPDEVSTNREPQKDDRDLERESEEYWTEERKAGAVPIPFPSLPAKFEPNEQEDRKKGMPQKGDSAEPDAKRIGGGLSACFATSLVSNMSVFPYQSVGKLYMTIGGNNYVGSAWVVGESTIATAGHCVHSGGGGAWATRLRFEGQYNRGSSIGSWTIRPDRLAAPVGWTRDRDYVHDMGFGIATRPIRPTTGRLGWLANYPANQGPYTQIGYPAVAISGYNFDGERMWQSVGNYLSGSSIIKACGNMSGGCSGGPWAVNFEGSWRGNGTNSHRYTDPNHIYSPYFGNNFVNLIEWMRTNGGD